MRNTIFKTMLTLVLLVLSGFSVKAQKYQTKVDTMFAGYRYEQVGDQYTKTVSTRGVMNGWTSTETKMVYYWQMGPGHTRADLTYKPAYMRMPTFGVKVERVMTGEVLYEATVPTTAYSTDLTKIEIIPDFVVPADEYYRVELTVNNASYVKSVHHFLFQRESSLPVIMSPSLGGTGSHLFDYGSTDPNAPGGASYDWAYMEAMVPYEYQHPCDYFMTIGALNSYMGIQTNGRVNGDDFDRRVLFSVWDNGNTDEDPDLPAYMRSQVFDYNHLGVSGHGGGEGSSGTIMFKDGTRWWRPDRWVQFLLNVRPERVTITMRGSKGQDSIGIAENTIMTAWYKMDTDTAWYYMASIRASFLNSLISGWYSFIENFGGGEGWGKHRVNYRHAFMRSAASGQWYNRNYVQYFPSTANRAVTNIGHGASASIDNCFYLEYGGYKLMSDSSHYTNLLTDHTCVDTIDLDRMNARIDQAIQLANRYVVNTDLNESAQTLPKSMWSIVSATGVNPEDMLDDKRNTHWYSRDGHHEVVLKAEESCTITSFLMLQQGGYGTRCRLVDVSYSDNGEDWTLGSDSIYIYNEDDTEVTLPKALTGQYFKLTFYDNIEGKNFALPDLTFKGAYDMEILKAKAEKLLKSENCLEGYTSEDLKAVREAYADGNCTDANALAEAIKEMGAVAMPLKYGRVVQKNHISSSSAYMLYSNDGSGFLCVTPEGKLTLRGATREDALKVYTDTATATNPYNSWRIILSEVYPDVVYVYNMGAKKYIDITSPTLLSDKPANASFVYTAQLISFGETDKSSDMYGSFVTVDPTSDDAIKLGARDIKFGFAMYTNNYLRPETQQSLDMIEEVFKPMRLETYKAKAEALLALPNNVIGSLADSVQKKNIRQLYDDLATYEDALPQLAKAIDTATLLTIDNAHTYRIVNTNAESTAPCLITTSGSLGVEALSAKDADQLWSMTAKNDAYVLTAQGRGIGMQPFSNNQRIPTSSTEKAFAYCFAPATPGNFYFAQSHYQPQTICGGAEYATTGSMSSADSQWKIEVVKDYTVSLNGAGIGLMYVDFDVTVPEDANVYVAYQITDEGIIKLCKIDSVIPARTPVVIKGNGYEAVTFGVMGHEANPYEGNNVLIGNLLKNSSMAKKTYYSLKTVSGNPVMKLGVVTSNIAKNQAYILVDPALPSLDTYTFDFDNVVSGVGDSVEVESANSPSAKYDLQGRPTTATEPGIYIINNKKVAK